MIKVTRRSLKETLRGVTIDLVVDPDGDSIMSRDMLTDFTHMFGFQRRYGCYKPEY